MEEIADRIKNNNNKKKQKQQQQNKTKENKTQNWNHMVDARAGPSPKTTLKPKKVKTLSGNRMKSNQTISKLQKEYKRHNSDAHNTTSSASPVQSPCYSNGSDEGSDTEMASSSNRTPAFSFLDLTHWKRKYTVGSSIRAIWRSPHRYSSL